MGESGVTNRVARILLIVRPGINLTGEARRVGAGARPVGVLCLPRQVSGTKTGEHEVSSLHTWV